MQVPLALFAIDPGERGFEPGDEIVAPGLVAVPPAAFDALGPGGELERIRREAARRLEQPGRPRTGLAEFARVPVAGLDASPGVLGTMIGHRRHAVDRVAPQAALQPLEQLRPALVLRGWIAEKAAALAR